METVVKAETEELQKEIKVTTKEAFKAALVHYCTKWNIYISSYWKIAKHFIGSDNTAGVRIFKRNFSTVFFLNLINVIWECQIDHKQNTSYQYPFEALNSTM